MNHPIQAILAATLVCVVPSGCSGKSAIERNTTYDTAAAFKDAPVESEYGCANGSEGPAAGRQAPGPAALMFLP